MHSIEELAGQHFDAVIVGGGINGTGLARDLALRAHSAKHPLRILLLEKSFWGAGTSGKNSHLIHGGLRYLKYFDFGLVREALRERATLLKLAPDTVRPLRFELTADGPIRPHLLRSRHRSLRLAGGQEPNWQEHIFWWPAFLLGCHE